MKMILILLPALFIPRFSIVILINGRNAVEKIMSLLSNSGSLNADIVFEFKTSSVTPSEQNYINFENSTIF